MTNTPRGDIAITIDGEHYTIRPTFQSLCEIESTTGRPILTLAEKLSDGELGLSDMAEIIAAGIQAGSYVSLNKEVIGKEIMRIGIAAFLAVIAEFFKVALTGQVSGGGTKKKPASSLVTG